MEPKNEAQYCRRQQRQEEHGKWTMHIVRTNQVPKDTNPDREKKRRCANDCATPSIRMPYPTQDGDHANNQTDQIGAEE